MIKRFKGSGFLKAGKRYLRRRRLRRSIQEKTAAALIGGIAYRSATKEKRKRKKETDKLAEQLIESLKKQNRKK